jgi:RNA polymerase sigma-70 factor (ECF subfamily)
MVERARRGDEAAYTELVRRYQRKALAVATGMLHDPDEARDVCQEAFLRAHKNLATFEGDAQFFTWLYRIIMNLCIDCIRKRRGQRVEFDEAVGDDAGDPTGITPKRLGFDPQRALHDKELRRELLSALERLSPTHRAVLIMREVDGLSYQEMADTVGCSIGTVMSRLFHARKKMQRMLIEYRRAMTPAA